MACETLLAKTTVLETCVLMRQHKASAFFVVDEIGKVVGIVSEQDIVRRVVAAEQNAATLALDEVMTPRPVVVYVMGDKAMEDEAAMKLMNQNNIRHVPMVDGQGRFVRAVDIMAVSAAAVGRRPSLMESLSRAAKKFMRTQSKAEAAPVGGGHSVPAKQIIQRMSTTVLEAAVFMRDHRLSALIVESEYHCSGIVTESDIARRCVAAGREPAKTMLGEIMTPNPLSVPLDTQPRDALAKMLARGFRHLPVCGPKGELVFILDVLSVMRSANQLATPAALPLAPPPPARAAPVPQANDGDEALPTTEAKDALNEDEADAAAALVAGDFARACEALDRAVAASQGDRRMRLLCRRGTVRSARGDTAGADADFEAVLAWTEWATSAADKAVLDEARAGWCEVLVEAGQYERAAAVARTAVDAGVRAKLNEVLLAERDAQREAGKELFKTGSFDDAITSFTSALRLNDACDDPRPDDFARTRAVCLANRAACYLQLQHADMAVDDCARAVEADAAYDKAWARWCMALAAKGEAREAHRVATRAQAQLGKLDMLERFLLPASPAKQPPPVPVASGQPSEAAMGKIKGLGLLFAQGLAPPLNENECGN